MNEPIRLLVADDHQPFRSGLRALLQSSDEVEIVAEAASGDEAVLLAHKHQPDVILMDLKMPGLNGIEASRRILNASPHIRILVLSMFEDDDSVFAALRAGARGYLLKGAQKADILRAIRSVSSGEAIFGPSVAKRLAEHFSSLAPASAHAFPELTGREREILSLLAQHSTNAEIAARLGISSKTVRNHVSNILNKLQVIDRAQAILRAKQAGLGK